MENTTPKPKGGAWKVMGIISVVLGGLSIILSFVPCVGVMAIWSGILATILSIISLILASNAKAPKMMAIIALVVSIASIGVGYWQAHRMADAVSGSFQQSFDKMKAQVDSTNRADSIKNSKQ
jgi:hypothetical protein